MNGRFSEEEEVDSPASCQLQQVFATVVVARQEWDGGRVL